MFSLMLAMSNILVPTALVSCISKKEAIIETQEVQISKIVTPVKLLVACLMYPAK